MALDAGGTTPATYDLKRAVQEGMKMLDEYFENGEWRERINGSTLDIQFGEWCVLGQLFGRYATGLHVLGINSDDAVTVVSAGFLAPRDELYPALNEAWRSALAQ